MNKKSRLFAIVGVVALLLIAVVVVSTTTKRSGISDEYECEMVETQCSEGEEEALFRCDPMPTFEGGSIVEFRDWVESRVKYPEALKAEGVSQTVNLKFIVERDGSISNIELLRVCDPMFSDEAIRVVKEAPAWTPGMQDGEKVRINFTLPVRFNP